MVSGFSIIKNGDSLGYPYLEALRSLAPFVDEIVVAHGDSSDTTLGSLESLGSTLSVPLRILSSPWNPKNLTHGLELSRQTNVALDACAHDVCFYIQADEVLNEQDTQLLRQDLQRFAGDAEVDALALRWIHFYGNFDTVVESRRWYRREMRIIKRSRRLRSFGDAQGFRILPTTSPENWAKPRAALSRARLHHYGWVRPAEVMAKKTEALDRLWHGPKRDGTHSAEKIYPRLSGLQHFAGEHPTVMHERIHSAELRPPVNFPGDVPLAQRLRFGVERWIENLTDWRPGEFKNYRSLKKY